ncbi:MAG: guanine deaminase, partial [Pseudomonadota bacterium]
AETSYVECAELIARWHNRGRLAYAVTPRFAVTSSDAQLDVAGRLAAEHADIYVQTHLSENHEEIAAVRALFPDAATYTAVYDRFGLLGPRTLLGHCLHLDDSEVALLHERDAIAIWCPTSNNFLGSGLFDRDRLRAEPHPVRVGLATDVGGGTSYSMLQTAAEAYKVARLKGSNLTPFESFYLMTLGNARALKLEHEIGTLVAGSMADLVVLDLDGTPNLAHRIGAAHGDLESILFALTFLGDDRCVRATYVAGKEAFSRNS